MGAVSYQSVRSSNISEVGYDPDSQTLYVRFLNGSEYAYYGVPPDEFDALISAPSAGSYLNDAIKGQYKYARV